MSIKQIDVGFFDDYRKMLDMQMIEMCLGNRLLPIQRDYFTDTFTDTVLVRYVNCQKT